MERAVDRETLARLILTLALLATAASPARADDEGASAPRDAASAPRDATSAPHDAASAPHDATSAPHDATSAPHDATSAPHDADAPSDDEARRHFEIARRAYDTGDWGLAVTEFEEAHRLSGYAVILYNIYSAAERGGMWARAAEALERYLREAEVGENRADLEQRLARLRARIASESTGSATREPTVEGAAAPTSPGGGVHPLGIGLTIGGGALLAGFGVLATLAAIEDQALSEDCGAAAGAVCEPSRVNTLETLTLLADIAWIAGASVAIAGIVLLLVLPEDTAHPVGSEEALLSLRPWLAPTSAGVSVRGSF